MEERIWPPTAVNEHRLRLRPWLENMLDSGCIRGLEWLDLDKSFFKIPWKHRSKKDWDMEHIKVFMEWAKHTGKYQDGDEPDYVAMKTRLRCAFNKAPDIEEVHSLHRLKNNEPYKVYRFIHKPDMEAYNQDLAKTPPSASRVCTVQPTLVHKSNEDSDTDNVDSDMEDDSYAAHSETAQTSPTKHTLGAIREAYRRHKDSNQEIIVSTGSNDNPSTLAAAKMLLSLTNGHQGAADIQADRSAQPVIMVTATPNSVTHTASVSSVAIGLIPSLLLAPPRLPSSVGMLQSTGVRAQASAIDQIPTPAFPMPASVASQFMIKMPNIDMNELIGQPKLWPLNKPLSQIPGIKAHESQLALMNKPESQNYNVMGGLVGQPNLAMMKTPGMVDGKLRLVCVTMGGSMSSAVSPGKMTFSVHGGAPVPLSNMQYQIMNFPNEPHPTSEIIANAAMGNANRLKSAPIVSVQPLTMATNGVGHVEVVGISNHQARGRQVRREPEINKYVRTVDAELCKEVYKQKASAKRSLPAAGVTYSTQGSIMATGLNVVDKIKNAIARKGHGLVEETLRMRAAYGVATVDTLSGECEESPDEKMPPKLVPISPQTIAIYQRARKGGVVGSVRRRTIERDGEILDLRVSPDGSTDHDSDILDLSVKSESGRFRSAPACLTEEGALDLTLKRKLGAEPHRPSKRHTVKKGASLAVHAIWDLSQNPGNKQPEATSPEKPPTAAVDLRNSPDDSANVKVYSPIRSSASSSDEELSDHNYFSMIPVEFDDASQGIVVLETDTVAKAHEVSGKSGCKQSNTAVGHVKAEFSAPTAGQMAEEYMEVEEEEMEEDNDTTLAAKQLMQLAHGKSKSLPIEDIKGTVKKSSKKVADLQNESYSGNNWGSDLYKKGSPQPSTMAQKDGSRQRLRPWLESKISSGDIRGLEWIDQANGTFKIPWKHGGKHDWTPDNSRIFMEWARHTGRYRIGIDEEDYATWKTRLRCAFNKAPDIVEEKEKSDLNCSEPFRVYRLLPKSEIQRFLTPSSNYSEDEEQGQQASGNAPLPVVVQECAQEGVISYPSGAGATPSDLKNLPSLDLLQLRNCTGIQTHDQPYNWSLGEPQVVEEEPDFTTDPLTGAPYCIVTTHSDISMLQNQKDNLPISTYTPLTTYSDLNTISAATQEPYSGSFQSRIHPAVTLDNILNMASTTNMSVSPQITDTTAMTITSDMLNAAEEITSPMVHTLDYVTEMNARLTEENDLRIQLKYQNQILTQRDVSGQRGCLVASEGGTTTDQNTEELLYTPRVDSTSHQDQQISSLLQYMKQGVIFKSEHGNIYAKRHCQCGVYFTSSIGTRGLPQKLCRNDDQVIFDLQRDFEPAVKRYKEDGGPRPDPEVHLVFGQKSDLEGLNDSILITVTVTSLKALKLLKESTEEPMEADEQQVVTQDFLISDPSQPGDINQFAASVAPVVTQNMSLVDSGATTSVITTITTHSPLAALPNVVTNMT